MNDLEKIILPDFTLENGKKFQSPNLFYQLFGKPLGSAPIVLVNHALTGNSAITGENGWWKDLIGESKTINTLAYTVIAFNIPGNGFDGDIRNLIANYRDFTARDIAAIFWKALEQLGIDTLFAVIGGSLGGGIAWEMAALRPTAIENLVPIATDWKATDWVLANVLVQDRILNNSDDPVSDARLHAMLLYRTPQSLARRFNREKAENSTYKVESWLLGHGYKLQERFRLSAYKLMNHLLKTVDITRNRGSFITVGSQITANIHVVAVDTDYFYIPEENRATVQQLGNYKSNSWYHEINSIHGHDAFLVESQQLAHILAPVFNTIEQRRHA
jgi:homoserine O-acetyltransferase